MKKSIIAIIVAIIISIAPILYIPISIYIGYKRNNIPQDKIEYISAVIDSKNNSRRRSVENIYRFNYRFEINGKIFYGVVRDRTVYIGDYIEILYNKENPNINRPVVYHNQLIK